MRMNDHGRRGAAESLVVADRSFLDTARMTESPAEVRAEFEMAVTAG